ncbi:MAG TPA: hypothetical protein VHZ33_02830 [Trebonia sp.]|nr:hypothetical protein [Trebonia sp.]
MCAVRNAQEPGNHGRMRDPRNFPGSGWSPTSPPVDFHVYGLAASWPGARWLDGFGDEIGDPPRWVRLAHESADGASLIMVNTYSAPPTDAQAAQWGQPPEQEMAFDAVHVLINMTLPAASAKRPDGFIPRLAEHAANLAGQYARWPSVQWQVGGQTAAVAARVCRFAGGWAAIADPVDDVYVSAVGVGTGPEGLSLTRLEDGSAYHVDLDQPLHIGVMSASREASGAGDAEAPRWERRDWHPDQLELMR